MAVSSNSIGSTCFLVGPFPGYIDAVGPEIDAVTFFVGSIFFTGGGAMQTWLAFPDRRVGGLLAGVDDARDGLPRTVVSPPSDEHLLVTEDDGGDADEGEGSGADLLAEGEDELGSGHADQPRSRVGPGT